MSNHDRAACLLKDGRIAGAVAEERIDRRKRSEGVYRQSPRGVVLPPFAAIRRLLHDESISIDDVELLACGRSIGSCRQSLLDYVPINADRVVEPALPGHHLAHAYSAFGTASFPEAAVLVIDEQGHHVAGRFEKASWFAGGVGPLQPIRSFQGTSKDLSLGMLYSSVAALVSLAEGGRPAAGKLMALAAHGVDHTDWARIVELRADGDVRIPLDAFDEFLRSAGLKLGAGGQDVEPAEIDDLLVRFEQITWRSQLAADLARWVQAELSRAVLHLASGLRSHSTSDCLAYAGGVALNCTTNGRLREAGWRDVFVHPAATDDGNAVGLAMWGWVEKLGQCWPARRPFSPFLGPRYTEPDVSQALKEFGLREHADGTEASSIEAAADVVAAGNVLAWFDGRSEWGPRALGGRSFVANPRAPGIRRRLNQKIKHREEFRPVGVSGLADSLSEIVALDVVPSSLLPYMLTAAMAIRNDLPEITHLDNSIRVQVVDADEQRCWAELIRQVGYRTSMAVVINTSFNTFGEPLVESPRDAVRQFLLSDADALYLQGRFVSRDDLSSELLETAIAQAVRETSIDPISRAQALVDIGYPEEAKEFLGRLNFTAVSAARAGVARRRQYHSLMMQIAFALRDNDQAIREALEVFRWSAISDDARLAAKVAMSSESGYAQSIGQVMNAVSGVGGAFQLASAISTRGLG